MCKPRWRLAASESVGLSLLDCREERTVLFLHASTVLSLGLSETLSLLGDSPGEVMLFLALLWIFGEEHNVGSCIDDRLGEALTDRLDFLSEIRSSSAFV